MDCKPHGFYKLTFVNAFVFIFNTFNHVYPVKIIILWAEHHSNQGADEFFWQNNFITNVAQFFKCRTPHCKFPFCLPCPRQVLRGGKEREVSFAT